MNKPFQPTGENDCGRLFLRAAAARLEKDYIPKLEICLERLSKSDLWWRPNKACNCVGQLLLHLEGNLRQWVLCGLGGLEDDRKRDLEFSPTAQPSGTELRDRLRRTADEAVHILRNLPLPELLRIRRIQVYDVTGLHAALHAVEHFSGHTGQIIWITKLRTGKDLGFYSL